MTRPAHNWTGLITPADWGATYEDVQLLSQDGKTTLAGWYIPPQNGAVIILLHGFGGNRTGMGHHAIFLGKAGYGALMLDLRGHGQSGGEHRDWGWQDWRDIAAAVEFLQARPEVQHIGILGHSYGGQIALVSAAHLDALEAVVADGPGAATAGDIRLVTDSPVTVFIYLNVKFSDWLSAVYLDMSIPPSVVQQIPQLAGRPVFFIAAGKEPYEAEAARAYYDAASQPKTLWLVPDARHGQIWVKYPDEYDEHVTDFFDAALLGG
jgi:pimeloyl-ACP methyl ester carboxylesterase